MSQCSICWAILKIWALVWRQVNLHLLPLQIFPKVQTSGLFQRKLEGNLACSSKCFSKSSPQTLSSTDPCASAAPHVLKWNYATVRQKQGQEMTPWEVLLDSFGENETVNHYTVVMRPCCQANKYSDLAWYGCTSRCVLVCRGSRGISRSAVGLLETEELLTVLAIWIVKLMRGLGKMSVN